MKGEQTDGIGGGVGGCWVARDPIGAVASCNHGNRLPWRVSFGLGVCGAKCTEGEAGYCVSVKRALCKLDLGDAISLHKTSRFTNTEDRHGTVVS